MYDDDANVTFSVATTPDLDLEVRQNLEGPR